MAARSRIRAEMRPDDLDEALSRIALDSWTVTQIHEWSMERGYTFSRSAWGRFMKEFLEDWEDKQVLRLQARAFAQEFGGSAGLEVSDMAGVLLQKRALKVLQGMESPEPDDLRSLAQALTSVTRARVQTERLRQTQAKAKLEAFEEIEARLRRELATSRPDLWEGLQQWLHERRAEEQAVAEAA